MEHVALNNVQLDYLARDDPHLKPDVLRDGGL